MVIRVKEIRSTVVDNELKYHFSYIPVEPLFVMKKLIFCLKSKTPMTLIFEFSG